MTACTIFERGEGLLKISYQVHANPIGGPGSKWGRGGGFKPPPMFRGLAISRMRGMLGSAAGQHQLQQNQLVLSLNQSYFQLVNNQNALIDRFNRLEQLVLGGTPASSNLMVDTYGPLAGPLVDDVVDSAPNYSLFTGAQSPFNLNNCK